MTDSTFLLKLSIAITMVLLLAISLLLWSQTPELLIKRYQINHLDIFIKFFISLAILLILFLLWFFLDFLQQENSETFQ